MNLEAKTSEVLRPPVARSRAKEALLDVHQEGVNIKAEYEVGAVPPAAPNPSAPRPSPSPPAAPATPTSPPPLTACGAAAAPPQWGITALMWAAAKDKLDCLEYLIAKGANVNAQSYVRRGPVLGVAARGVGSGSERGRLRLADTLPRGQAVPRWRRCAPPPPRRAAAPLPAAGPRPPGSHASRQGSERGCGGGGGVGWAGGSHPPQTPATRRRRSLACVGRPPRVSAAHEDGTSPRG